ncbi:MAG TPA: hypothetical protein DD665_05560 [Alphaproteobacteria bacterium]|jgi:hypothetical protein|nr:hypothetical protein [Alphaproteobacteria bacterium]HBP59400.1 hypothetical protein [Alphaproteobacteria bacterium]HBP73025.1 hypothetical protein [Alphaproteobacteria bacterium]HCA91795.1 hypothetical protein [Alphaproteobacteria bacterium]HCD79383.1 hypothetical protein [Alphaproteobacteria bacterium]|tara:strand:- start:470 stop:763 length:294 start_codon:yes stop_codon:yes gene_type:complete
MRYARVNHVEFESKEALAEFEAQYTKTYAEAFPGMKMALSILTDKKTAMMINIYPDEDAANRSLEAPDALLADKGAKVREAFHFEGPVGVWEIIDPS